MAEDLADYHPAMIGADTANMQAGSAESFIANAGYFGKAAVLSGLSSIYNTAASLVGAEKFDTLKYLEENDAHAGEFYKQNQTVVDVGGFIGTSLLPGGLAVKGLGLAKAGIFGGPIARALGFAASKQQAYLEAGLKELASSGSSVYSVINKNTVSALAWATADQALTVGAFETAVALTMHSSPLLENDSVADTIKHIGLTSVAFGAIGGGIEAIAMNAIRKGAITKVDAAFREYDTLRKVEGNITDGDKAFGILDSMLSLPTVGKNIEFTYKLAGRENSLELPTKEGLERAFTSTQRRAWDDFNLTINKLAENDSELGQQFSGYVRKLVDDGLKNNVPNDELATRVQDYLLSVSKIKRVGENAAEGSDNIFYLSKKLTPEQLEKASISFDDFLSTVSSRAPTGNDVSKRPFKYIPQDGSLPSIGVVGTFDETMAQVAGKYASAKEVFKAGHDVAVYPDGTLRINDKSAFFKHVDDPVLTPRQYFNVKTGAFTDVAFPTVADVATTSRPLAVTGPDMVVAGGKSWKQAATTDFDIAALDSLGTSARYAWAGARNAGDTAYLSAVPARVNAGDLPLLERIFQDGPAKYADVVIFGENFEKKVGDIPDFAAYLMQEKLARLEQFFSAGNKADLSDIAVRLNTDIVWIEKAVTANFAAMPELSNGFSVPLRDSLKPQNMEVFWDFSKQLPKDAVKNAQKYMMQQLPDGANNVVFGKLAYDYRVKAAKQAYEQASTAVLGAEDAAQFIELTPEVATSIADRMGAGAGLLKFSNADYGDQLRLWSQWTGQQVHLIGQKWANRTLEELQPLMIRIKEDPKAAAELGVLVTALRRNPDKFVVDGTNAKRLINQAAAKKEEGIWVLDEAKVSDIEKAGRRISYEMESDDVARFISAHQSANARRIEKQKVLYTSRGWNSNYDPDVVYAPAVDTGRYPFFAFVRQRDGILNGSSEVSMITARNEAELRSLTAKVPSEYEVIFKADAEKFHKAKGDYDYALSLKEPTIDNTLQRKGVLGDFFPETRAENVLDDFIGFHQRSEVGLVRKVVETRYAQTFAELRSLGEQFQQTASSRFGGVLKKFRSQVEDPFGDYLKTALDISKRSEYTLLHEANEFAEGLGKTAYSTFLYQQDRAMKGLVSWEEANSIASKYGIAGPYTGAESYIAANAPAERSVVKAFVSKANMMLVNLTLRLDWANSLVNVISTPILLGTELASIRSLVANDSALAGKLAELRSIPVPGAQGVAVPSNLKLIANAIQNFWGPEKAALLRRYKETGAVKDMLSEYHEMVEEFAWKPYAKSSDIVKAGNRAIDIGARFSGSEFAEQLTRFVSADVMRQLTDPIVASGRLTVAEQNAYISVFVNRVQGNYLASQRPIAFQGVLGSAVSLFQTYQFNLLQQLFRHIENKDTRALATLTGLQAGLYGLNGIPFFEAVNTHLVGRSKLNPDHHDAYSVSAEASSAITGSTALGNWMMYGTASAFPLFGSKSPALYTRGDINPRHISIIPVTPLDVPAVDGSIRFVSNLLDTGKKLVAGADISGTLLEGLEHNSLNRPLAGIAQVFAERSTTSKGSLISAANDFSVVATLSRVAGAKPMDEALALNSLFRLNAYQAADQAKIQQLGEVVKTKLRAGKAPTPEEIQEFQLQYAKYGGRIENYAKTLQRWMRDSNVSVVNQTLAQHRSSYSQRLMEIMGGQPLSDYRTAADFGSTTPVQESE